MSCVRGSGLIIKQCCDLRKPRRLNEKEISNFYQTEELTFVSEIDTKRIQSTQGKYLTSWHERRLQIPIIFTFKMKLQIFYEIFQFGKRLEIAGESHFFKLLSIE